MNIIFVKGRIVDFVIISNAPFLREFSSHLTLQSTINLSCTTVAAFNFSHRKPKGIGDRPNSGDKYLLHCELGELLQRRP